MKTTVTLTNLTKSEVLNFLTGEENVIYGTKGKLTITLKNGDTKYFQRGTAFVVLYGKQILPLFEKVEELDNDIDYHFDGYLSQVFNINDIVSISFDK